MLRRTARQHETLRTQAGVQADSYADFNVRERVMTVDGYAGRIEAVHDGPFPGSEEYDVKLDGGMGGGLYSAAQLKKMADEEYTATKDYPELAEILAERPDPGKQVILAKKTASTLPDDHKDKVYLRFGDWPDDERSSNNVTGFKEDGVSVYDLDHHGEPMDPDPEYNRGHEHDEHCEPDCDLDAYNDEFGNDTKEEMQGRVNRAEKARRRGVSARWDDGHLVKGKMIGIGHDGEPLLNNVKRVGDWINHRHLFIPTAEPHRLASHPDDDDYEPPEHPPHTATTINDVKIDGHGDAPHEVRADDPNGYDKKSTEGDPDPKMSEPLSERDEKGAHAGEIMKAPAGVSFSSLKDLLVPAQVHAHVDRRMDPQADEESAGHLIDAHGMDPDDVDNAELDGRLKEIHEQEHDPAWTDSATFTHQHHHRAPTKQDLYAENLGDPLDVGPSGRRTTWESHPGGRPVRDALPTLLETQPGRFDDVERAKHNNLPNHKLNQLLVRADWNDPEEGLDHHRDHDWGGIDSGHGEGGEWHDPEEARCYYKHDGPCPELGDVEPKLPMGHTAMPSKYHPEPEGFNYRVEPTGSRYPGASTHALYGFVGPHHVGTLHFTKSDDNRAVKVDMLHAHDKMEGVKGVGSAMMDALHDEHPEAWINHGERTRPGLKWWASYDDPAPERNVHNHTPDSGWAEYFHPRRVSMDMAQNYGYDPEHNPLPHNSSGYGEPEREADTGLPIDIHGPHWTEHHHAQGHDGGRVYDDEDRELSSTQASRSSDGLDDVLFPGGNAFDNWDERMPTEAHLMLPEIGRDEHHRENEAETRQHLLDHHGFSNDQLANIVDPGQGDAATMAHEMEHGADPVYTEYGSGEVDGTRIPHEHKNEDHSGGGRWVTDTELIPNGPGFTSLNRLSDPYELVATAATDAELRWHFTASWSDVRAKAKRIRTEGKVRVTLATDGMIIGEVQGDHHTYESGIQRLPGQRLSVSGWSCGCKWGAYHWGASDDFSRFAGRMCSHALALQFEAQSRGMFGNVVEIDKTKPDWVPPRVVVKHDIDSGQNRLVRSSAKNAGEMRPVDIFAFLAMHQEGETITGIQMLLSTAGLVEGAANDPWGEPTVETPPKPYGATSPPNPYESPASAGPLTASDPDSWGHLDPSGMLVSSTLHEATPDEARDYNWSPEERDGAEATLHDEPEGALPRTDGDLEDADLEPENPSIQTMGNQIGGDDEVMDDARPTGEDDDVVSQFQASAAAKSLMGEGGGSAGGYSNSDIAAHASKVLALKAFSPAEQAALINEGMDVQASNLDRLDIAGTHYAEMEDDEGDSWMI